MPAHPRTSRTAHCNFNQCTRETHGEMAPKIKTRRDSRRLEFVRKMRCLIPEACNDLMLVDTHFAESHALCRPYGARNEAHHVYNGGSGGTGLKPDDFRTVPLCQAAHEEFHRIGKNSFEAKYGLDLEAHIERINAEYARQAKPKREKKPPERIAVTVNNCSRCGGTHKFPVKDGLSKNVGFFKDSKRRVKMKFFCKGWIGK